MIDGTARFNGSVSFFQTEDGQVIATVGLSAVSHGALAEDNRWFGDVTLMVDGHVASSTNQFTVPEPSKINPPINDLNFTLVGTANLSLPCKGNSIQIFINASYSNADNGVMNYNWNITIPHN